MNDQDYYDVWQRAATSESPMVQAVEAGKVAPNPGTVFIAGYQAAIRATFPELGGKRWYSFAVSEDRGPDSQRPGVTFNGHLVSGFKTWIAAVNCVDALVVKVGSGVSAKYGVVDAKGDGVVLSSKDKPGFLPTLSQGMAEFRNARFDELNDASGVSQFAQHEHFHIYLAFVARLSSLDWRGSNQANQILQEQEQSRDLVNLDAGVAELLVEMKEVGLELGDNWQTDQRLFRMYG